MPSLSVLMDDQEMYTVEMVKARLRFGGAFHARSFTTGKLLWVIAIEGNYVRVNYSMSITEFMFPISNLKTL